MSEKALKVVLTGGPSAGKTLLAKKIQTELGTDMAVVPEAASLLLAGGWPRQREGFARRCQQVAIYHVQRELEALIEYSSRVRLLLCDRGSLDGLAYWPDQGTREDFFSAVQSSLSNEVSRYDAVIHVTTAPREHYDTTNPLRLENYDEAIEIDRRIRVAWEKHPQRFIIENDISGDFEPKQSRAIETLRRLLSQFGPAKK